MRVPRLSALIQRISAALLTAALGVAAPRAARAEERYETLFKQGRKEMEAKNFPKACALFQESLDLGAPVGALLNLADCQDKLGHPARSLTLWTEGLAKLPPDDPRQDLAKRSLEDVRLRVARIAVVWADADAAAKAFVDTQQVPIGGDPIAVDPGAHQVTLTDASGSRTVDVTVASGELESVNGAPPARPGAPRFLIAGIASLGVATAGVLGAAITGGMWLDEKRTVDARCPARPCADAIARDAADRAEALGVSNVVLWVVAGAGAAAGVTLLVVHAKTWRSVDDNATSTSIVWTGTGLAVRQSF